MLGRLLGLFRKDPIRIEGVAALPEGESRKVTIGDPLSGSGTDLILAKVDGVVHAVDSRCPHAGGFITDGPLAEGRFVVCPLHNYRFDPASGACTNAPCGKARTYRSEADGDALRVWI
jgi:nitrite reductase/ring-hydroxylating ferredoxin subunit